MYNMSGYTYFVSLIVQSPQQKICSSKLPIHKFPWHSQRSAHSRLLTQPHGEINGVTFLVGLTA